MTDASPSPAADVRQEMVSVIVHHLRNRLSRILFTAEIVGRSAAEVPALAGTASRLRRGVDELIASFDQLFELARVLDETATPRVEEVDLVAVVRDSVEAARPLFSSMQHEVTLDLPGAPVLAPVDRVDLELAIANLLTNAAKFTPHGGKIGVRLEADDRELRIVVIDSGIGIAPERLAHLFDGFVSAHPPGTSRGLKAGLLVVRRVAEMHGGHVEAHSAGPGTGTEVRIRLPRRREVAGPAAPRCLLVDAGAGAGAPTLRSWGYHVRHERDSAAALTCARAWTPELVLVVATAPAEDAQLAEALRAAVPQARLVLLGGEADGYDATLPEEYDAELLQAAVMGTSRPT